MSQVDLKQLKLEDVELIDSACESFQMRWRNDDARPSIDDFLVGFPNELQAPLALELIEMELSLRRGAGETPLTSEYCERYPHWTDQIASLEATSSDSVTLPPQSIDLPKQIPGYELGEELGRGGMGVVYKALHVGLGRRVALKMAIIQAGPSRNEIERFRTEAESAARLHHPNIAQIFEIGSIGRVPFYTMELVEGGNLNQALAKQPLGPASAAELLIHVAQAVAYAHDMGIVHRDLKPSNILLQTRPSSAGSSAFPKDSLQYRSSTSTGWVPKITDFGLAKKIDSQGGHTLTGVVVGTPDYISPEQTYGRSDQVGPATDIYALGAILYESIVGRPPFRSANLFETLEQVRFKDPVPPSRIQSSVPRDLETICLKCLEKQPQNRYATAGELAADLDRFLQGLPIAARPVSRLEQGFRWTRRNPVVASMIALITLLTMAVILVPSWLVIRLNQALKVSDAFAIQAAKNEHEARARAAAMAEAKLATENIHRESQGHLVGMRIAAGDSCSNASNSLRALLWYAHAWTDDRYDSRHEFEHRMRIGQAIRQLPQLVGLCIHKHAVDDFYVNSSLNRAVLLDEHQNATLWNPTRGELLGTLDHGWPVASVTLVEKANQAITSGGASVRLWNIDTPELSREWKTKAEVKSSDISHDEVWVAAACSDNIIRVWSRETGAEHPLSDTQGTNWATDSTPVWASFTPDSRALLAIDQEHRLYVWNLDSGALLTDKLKHDLFPTHERSLPKFHSDGHLLVTWADKEFSLIDTTTWQVVAKRDTVANATDFAWDKSFKQMVFATRSSLFRWLTVTDDDASSFETNALVDTVAPRQTMLCDQSADGSLAAVSSSGGVINVYKSDKHELFVRMRVLGEVTQLRFVDLEDGTQSLVASGLDGTVRVWVLRQPSFRNLDFDYEAELPGQSEWIERDGQKLTLSPDGNREVYFSDRVLKLRARHAQVDITTLEFESTLQRISFAKKATRMAVSDSTSCRVFDTTNGRCIGELYRGQASLLRIQLSNDGQRLMTWRAGQAASVWDVDSQSQLLGIEGNPAANDFEMQSKGREIHDVRLSSDGKQLIQRLERYPRTQIYRVDSGDLITETDTQIGIAAPIAISTDTDRFLIGNSDTRARVWDAAQGKPVGPLLQHPSFVRLGCLSPDGELAATFAADGKFRIWNSTRGDLILSGEMALQRGKFWFGSDSRRLFIRHQSGVMHEIGIPRWDADLDVLNSLIELHSCERIDETQGIADLTVEHFRNNQATFIEAWKSSLPIY